MRKLFVFLGVVLMTIGSAVSAQEVDSTVPLQKSSWGDAKTTQAGDYIPEVSLKMRGGYNQDFAENAGRFYGDGPRTGHQQSVLIRARVHPFPFRTRKLSSLLPKILVWRRTGKIGNADTKNRTVI